MTKQSFFRFSICPVPSSHVVCPLSLFALLSTLMYRLLSLVFRPSSLLPLLVYRSTSVVLRVLSFVFRPPSSLIPPLIFLVSRPCIACPSTSSLLPHFSSMVSLSSSLIFRLSSLVYRPLSFVPRPMFLVRCPLFISSLVFCPPFHVSLSVYLALCSWPLFFNPWLVTRSVVVCLHPSRSLPVCCHSFLVSCLIYPCTYHTYMHTCVLYIVQVDKKTTQYHLWKFLLICSMYSR